MSKHLSHKKAHEAASKQTRQARGAGLSSGWNRVDYGVREQHLGPIRYYETFVRSAIRK